MTRAINSSLLDVRRVSQVLERVSLIVDHVGKPPRYAAEPPIGVRAFIWSNQEKGRAAVLLVDCDQGASVTNSADWILPFLHRQHIGPRGILWRNVRWAYRDTMGAWDEITMIAFDGGNSAVVGFRPLGDRTQGAALEAVAAAGFHVDAHDRAHLRNTIRSAGH